MQAALAREARRSSYLAVQGLAELREAVASYYGGRLGCDFSAETTVHISRQQSGDVCAADGA